MSRRFLARPSTRQRWPARPLRRLLPADRDAHLYRQTWQSVNVPQSRTDFWVLAFDLDEAAVLGRYRLGGMGLDPAMRLVVNTPAPWNADLVAAVLEVERSEETDTRHMAHSRREAGRMRRG